MSLPARKDLGLDLDRRAGSVGTNTGRSWNLAGGVLRELDEQQGCEEDGDAERKEAGEALKHLEGLGRRAGSGVERLDSRY